MPVAYAYPLSLKAVELITVTFQRMLPTGRTVASAEAWLEAPNGVTTAVSGPNVSVSTPNVTVKVGPFSALGDYRLNILATTNGSPVAKMPAAVEFTVAWSDDGT